MSRRGNAGPPPWPLPRAAPSPAPGWSLLQRTGGSWEVREGSCHASAGREKQPRACPAGQEVLERPDPAHRKAKGGKEVDLEGEERRDRGTGRGQGREETQLQKASAHGGQRCRGWGSCPIPQDNIGSNKNGGQTLSCRMCPTSPPSTFSPSSTKPPCQLAAPPARPALGTEGPWGQHPPHVPALSAWGHSLGPLVSQPFPHPAEETEAILPPAVPQTDSSSQGHFLFPQKASESQQEPF